jgi:hypothetical protein
MRVFFVLGAIVLFVISLFLISEKFANMPHTLTNTQLGLASCGFAIAGGLALVAAALANRGEVPPCPPRDK